MDFFFLPLYFFSGTKIVSYHGDSYYKMTQSLSALQNNTVSIFFTCLLSVVTAMISDTQKLKILGFSTAHINTKQNQTAMKNEARQQKYYNFID